MRITNLSFQRENNLSCCTHSKPWIGWVDLGGRMLMVTMMVMVLVMVLVMVGVMMTKSAITKDITMQRGLA